MSVIRIETLMSPPLSTKVGGPRTADHPLFLLFVPVLTSSTFAMYLLFRPLLSSHLLDPATSSLLRIRPAETLHCGLTSLLQVVLL